MPLLCVACVSCGMPPRDPSPPPVCESAGRPRPETKGWKAMVSPYPGGGSHSRGGAGGLRPCAAPTRGGALACGPARRTSLAAPGSDFKAVVPGGEWVCARPKVPTAPPAVTPSPLPHRCAHVTPAPPPRLRLPPPQSPRRGCAASCPRRAPRAAASPSVTWPAPPCGGPRPWIVARLASESGSEATGRARPRSERPPRPGSPGSVGSLRSA